MTATVSSGVTSSGLTLSAGETASVLSAGTAEMFVVSSGGEEIVFSGGLSLGDTINAGGRLVLSQGGVASSLTIAAAGVASGGGMLAGVTTDDGLVSGLQVGGVLSVGSGGAAQGVTILGGGSAVILSGGTDSGAVVLSGGVELVSQGGSAIGLSLASGATLTDNGVVTYSGAAGVTLAGTVLGGGTLVQDGAGELVLSATAPVSVDVTVSGTQGPWSPSENPGLKYGPDPVGGEASVTGSLSFAPGAQITVTYLSGTAGTEQGVPQFDAGGNKSFVAEGNGYPGSFIPTNDQPAYHGELLGAFANAAGKVIGSPFVLGDGPTTVTVPAGGATQLLLGVNDNDFTDNNGALAIEVSEDGGGGSPSLVISGGVAQLAVADALGGAGVVFAPGAGSSATLAIAAADLPANGGSLLNPLSNFNAAVDALDLQGLAYVSGATAVASGGALTVTDGSDVLHFTLEGAVFPSFVASSDGDGGLIVRAQQTLTLSAGVVSSGLNVGSGDQLTVLSGGEVEDSTVLSGGSATISAGAVGAGLTVSTGGQFNGPGDLLGSSFAAGQVGGLSVGSAANASGYLEILSGGSAGGVTVADGELKIDFGGTASGTALSGPGAQDDVLGVASGTVVGSGQKEVVGMGGLASGAAVLSGGAEIVSSGGSALGAVLSGGASEIVMASGTTTGTQVGDGASELVEAGGFGIATTLSGGGQVYIHGLADGDIVSNGGQEIIRSSGAASGSTLLSGGVAFVHGATSGAVVSDGGREIVRSGGVASRTTLSGGEEDVDAGGVANATTVLSGGLAYVYGATSGAIVSSGGKAIVRLGGVASGLLLLSGGVLIDGGEVTYAGSATLAGSLSGSGSIVQTASGALRIGGNGAAFRGVAVISGGTIELATSGALGRGNVQFVEPTTGSAVLQIDVADAPKAGGVFANTISNFSGALEAIDLRSIAFVSGASAKVSGSVLSLTDGGKTYTFNLAGAAAGAYSVLKDKHGGTLIDPAVTNFVQAAAAFAPPGAARAAIGFASPDQTPFLHVTASATAQPH
jgi:autotransporter passenger strand-loop-strand repeat protein